VERDDEEDEEDEEEEDEEDEEDEEEEEGEEEGGGGEAHVSAVSGGETVPSFCGEAGAALALRFP